MRREEIEEAAQVAYKDCGGEPWPHNMSDFAILIANRILSEVEKACEAERVDEDATSDSSDHAYNNAITDCCVHIRALKIK